MTLPTLELSQGALADANVDAVVLVVSDLSGSSSALAPFDRLAASLSGIGFTGAASAFVRVPAPDVTELPFAVVGAGSSPDAQSVREAVGAAVRSFTGFSRLGVLLVDELAPFADAAAEGALLGGYRFDDYRTSEEKKRAETVVLFANVADDVLTRAAAVADAVALTKDLINTPAGWLGPADLADRAVEAVADLDDVTIEVLDEHELEAQGYGGILGVGRGSVRPPRMVRVDYAPAGATSHIALVGKGITFDTGGLWLKPAASMVGMKFDMAGAASVLAALRAIATLRLPVRVSAWMCIAENMPSGSATRPGDVLRMLDGKTVEVLNTDAEGRLVLADGLAAASREKPDLIVDVATLTGAIIVALGMRHTGVFGDDDSVQEILDAAHGVGELAWAMPMPDHMEEELKSPLADLANVKVGDPAAGASFAALFLRRFVGPTSDDADAPRIPWVHLDIAGSSEHKGSPYGYTEKGPTGSMVRTLVALAEARATGSNA
ncbi:leucyl aminopeptidase [Microbacterium keratanolyticum]|uniref:Probable cytosol aminopeptidase n=2 Tax=Microbacterium keratanolyticum TaxID=67574 RepID=A0A9W6HV38_9MICO|nr:leucyl aminopeptidase [Microbacterium keratanolyticum]MBM7467516.1 leucyl aminopeptidase [Microbacterium keratanolyticum]GLK02505.1 putative cytosol aminopeptidase [Microbacterium keratanolyticum]